MAAVALMLAACLLAAGCNGARETDEVAFVISVGIDKGEDKDLLVSYRIAVPQAMAAGADGGGGDKKSPSTLETVKAPSLAEARNILNATLSRELSLQHVTAVVVSEELARQGVQDVIPPLLRFREFRSTVFLVVARGKPAAEIMRENKPTIESLVSRWVLNYMHHADEVGYFLPLRLHEFYMRLKSKSGAPLAVGYASNPLTGQGDPQARQPDGRVDTYLPGDMPRQGGNPSEFVGTAVFRGDKLAGFLDTGETRVLAMVLGELRRSYITVADPLEPQQVIPVIIRNGRATKIKVDISGERPCTTVDVLLEGEITGVASGINYEAKEYLTLLERQVSGVIREQTVNMLVKTRGWGADVADFGYHVRPKFLTIQAMEEYGWGERFRQAEFEVRVETEIRRTGLMRKTWEIRRD